MTVTNITELSSLCVLTFFAIIVVCYQGRRRLNTIYRSTIVAEKVAEERSDLPTLGDDFDPSSAHNHVHNTYLDPHIDEEAPSNLASISTHATGEVQLTVNLSRSRLLNMLPHAHYGSVTLRDLYEYQTIRDSTAGESSMHTPCPTSPLSGSPPSQQLGIAQFHMSEFSAKSEPPSTLESDDGLLDKSAVTVSLGLRSKNLHEREMHNSWNSSSCPSPLTSEVRSSATRLSTI
jgi:hypothetical protein